MLLWRHRKAMAVLHTTRVLGQGSVLLTPDPGPFCVFSLPAVLSGVRQWGYRHSGDALSVQHPGHCRWWARTTLSTQQGAWFRPPQQRSLA